MTMKKKIFLSNTAMMLLSLLILFGIAGIGVLLFKDEFMGVIEENAELSPDTYEVQALLMDRQAAPNTWKELSEELSEYHFELYVSDMNQKKQYSNVRPGEWECIEELEQSIFESDQISLYSMENATIAKCIINNDGTDYYVYAIYYPADLTLWGMERGMFEMFIILFVISGVIVIAGLLLCCQIFTRVMIKKIMQPVDELNLAAGRINNGNFNEPICYKNKDEFKEVCDTFNTMQRNLKEEMERTEKYEKARTEMISGISHDLRTPLTSIKGFIKGMLDGVASTPEKQKQYLELSYKKAGDMEMLLQKLFFYSKLETGNMPFFPQKIELSKWLEKYVEEKKIEGTAKGYELLLKEDKDEYSVNIDIEQMKRVFDNLIENSVKYANSGDLCICVELQKKGKNIVLTFKDNGVGVSNDKLPFVFDQFYRGDESRNSKNEGSGLGLYVCKYIVEEHQGTISAFSDNGFAVAIELPIEQ